MNRQIARVGIATLVLLVALVVGSTYWQTLAVADLKDRQDNAIQRVAQFKVKRGLILAHNGTVLATNVKRKAGGQTLYFRRYPTRGLFAQTVGYSTQARSQTGLERAENDYLTGSNGNLASTFDAALDRIQGTTIKGNTLRLNVLPGAQRVAMNALAGKCGAVVALEPHTGRVRVIASNPTYNPNLVEKRYAEIQKAPNICKGSSSALYNRATQGVYTPGSTFKIVTAAAALDTGRYTADSPFYDPGYCEEYGDRVRNAGNPEAPETFGSVNFLVGFQHSINSVFCNIGKAIGAKTILQYARRFGFYSRPPLELPDNQRFASGLYVHGEPWWPKDFNKVDPGRLAFGQERMLVTPLQAAMVAATVANGGEVIEPQLVDRIVSPGGKTVVGYHPHALGRAIKRSTAATLTQFMVAAVN